MEGSLYDNLLKATNNVDDITTEKYGVITKLYGLYCNVKESGTGLEHSNVPIVNGANLSVGDKVIIGFINNSIYNVVVYGSLDKQVHDNTKQDQLISGTNIKTINSESILGSGNLVIQGGSSVDIVTEWETTLSDSKVASEKLTKDSLDGKADSSHTHTVSNITDFPSIPSDVSDLTDNNDVIPTKISDLTNDSDFIEKSNTTGLVKNDGTIDTTSYSTFSGSYNDLSNKPSIPSSSSDLSDGSNIVKKSSTSGLLKNDGSVDTTAYSTFDGNYNNLTNKPTIPTIPTNVSAFTNDVGYLTQHQSLANYIQKSSTSGLLKNDGTVDTTSYLSSLPSHTHDDRYYTESEMDSLLNNKLDVEDAFSGSYNDLSDVPTSFNPSSHNHSISDVSNLQTSLNAKLETGDVGSAALSNDYYDLDNLPSLFDGDYDSLTNKPSIPSKTSELTNDGDGTNVFVKNNDSRLSDSRTPTSHRASATTYGVGNASYYGHCRVINNLTKSSHTDGYALSAYQGYILKQDVDGKASSTHNHTKSDITDFPTLHTVATSGSYNDLLDKPNIPSGVVVDLNLDGTSNNAVANSAVVGGLNDKIEASDISFGFDADTKEIYIEVN